MNDKEKIVIFPMDEEAAFRVSVNNAPAFTMPPKIPFKKQLFNVLYNSAIILAPTLLLANFTAIVVLVVLKITG